MQHKNEADANVDCRMNCDNRRHVLHVHCLICVRYDYVELFDGKSAESKRLGQYCGNQVPEIITHIMTSFIPVSSLGIFSRC